MRALSHAPVQLHAAKAGLLTGTAGTAAHQAGHQTSSETSGRATKGLTGARVPL